MLLHSVDFHEIEECQRRGEWTKPGIFWLRRRLAYSGRAQKYCVMYQYDAQSGGCHWVSLPLPFLHIADATGRAITGAGMLVWRCWVHVTPWNRIFIAGGDGTIFHQLSYSWSGWTGEDYQIIFEELCLGQFTEASRAYMRKWLLAWQNRGRRVSFLAVGNWFTGARRAQCSACVWYRAIHAEDAVAFMLS